MSNTPKKPKPKEIETEPDAWERFENAVEVLTHTPPKPRKATVRGPRKRKADAKK